MKTKTMQEEYVERLKEVRDIAAKAEAEDRDFTADEREEIVRRTDELKSLKAKIQEAKGDDELRKALDQLGDDIGVGHGVDDRRDPTPAGKGQTLGERFVNSAEMKSFLEQFPGGRIPDSAKGIRSAPVQFKDVLTGGGADSAGVFVNPDRTGILEMLGRRELTIRDLVAVRQTGSDAVEYVRQLTNLNAAAPVPEATTADPVGSGADPEAEPPVAGVTLEEAGVKPRGTFTFQRVQEAVSTIAVWVPATKRALSDAAQLRGLIDDELRGDLNEELEDQMLSGDGDGENFTGLANVSGVQTQAPSSAVDGLDPLLETTYRARTKVRVGGRARPSGYVIHPIDWERIHLARLAKNPANEGMNGGILTLHGLPVVESEGVPQGTAYVADWSKAVLWDRQQTTIQVSDSHADFFVRNLVAVLAELRAAFGVLRPAAFVKITLPS